MFSNFENRTGSWERDTQTHTSESHFIGMEKNTVHIIQESSLVLNIGYVSNETNEDVRMYIEEFILVDIWIHCCTKLKS